MIVKVEDECASTHLLPGRLRRKKSADIVNEAYPLLVGVKLGAVRDFNYEARDKYALTGYLTLPRRALRKKIFRWW